MPLSSKLVEKYARLLSDSFPLGYPLRIRIRNKLYRNREPVHGYSVKKNGIGWIYLNRYEESVMVDYLFHEYCHLYCEEVEGEHDDDHHHGDAFWLQHGEMYRLYE